MYIMAFMCFLVKSCFPIKRMDGRGESREPDNCKVQNSIKVLPQRSQKTLRIPCFLHSEFRVLSGGSFSIRDLLVLVIRCISKSCQTTSASS